MIIKTNANAPVDPLKLDQTGEFMQTGRKSPDKKPQKVSPQVAEWEKLFLTESFFLYENRDRILSDRRMSLTPTPFKNGLAYTGSSGLGDATLGVYLEWWGTCKRSVIKYDGEVLGLTYRIAGSPLSGSNSCSAVNREGRTFTVRFISPFSDIWSSFMSINSRYADIKKHYPASVYTLEETIAKLKDTYDK